MGQNIALMCMDVEVSLKVDSSMPNFTLSVQGWGVGLQNWTLQNFGI